MRDLVDGKKKPTDITPLDIVKASPDALVVAAAQDITNRITSEINKVMPKVTIPRLVINGWSFSFKIDKTYRFGFNPYEIYEGGEVPNDFPQIDIPGLPDVPDIRIIVENINSLNSNEYMSLRTRKEGGWEQSKLKTFQSGDRTFLMTCICLT